MAVNRPPWSDARDTPLTISPEDLLGGGRSLSAQSRGGAVAHRLQAERDSARWGVQFSGSSTSPRRGRPIGLQLNLQTTDNFPRISGKNCRVPGFHPLQNLSAITFAFGAPGSSPMG